MKTHKLHKHQWTSAGELSSTARSFDWCEKCGALKITDMHYGSNDTVRIIRPSMSH
jgi:hypothetical protein